MQLLSPLYPVKTGPRAAYWSLVTAGRRVCRHFAYMELVEEHRVCVPSRLRCFPELLLRRVAVHGTQSEQTVWK